MEVVCTGCSDIKLIATGKRNEKGGFDINSKVVLGMFSNRSNKYAQCFYVSSKTRPGVIIFKHPK